MELKFQLIRKINRLKSHSYGQSTSCNWKLDQPQTWPIVYCASDIWFVKMLQRLNQFDPVDLHAFSRFRSSDRLFEVRKRKRQEDRINFIGPRTRAKGTIISKVRIKQRYVDFITKLSLSSFLDAITREIGREFRWEYSQGFQTLADFHANDIIPYFSTTKWSQDDIGASSRSQSQLAEVLHINFGTVI